MLRGWWVSSTIKMKAMNAWFFLSWSTQVCAQGALLLRETQEEHEKCYFPARNKGIVESRGARSLFGL